MSTQISPHEFICLNPQWKQTKKEKKENPTDAWATSDPQSPDPVLNL